MPTTMAFDVQRAAHVEALYSTPDIAATRVAAFRAVNPSLGETVMDLGCGPGFMLRDLAVAVGRGGKAIGVDISDPMLAIAQRRCADLSQVTLHNAEVAKLPVADGAADAACIMQVYAYVRELDAALRELRRVLRPGGRAIILDTDFSGVVWQSRDRERMKRVMTAYDAHVAWPDLPRILPERLRAAGFRLERCEVVPIVTTNYHPQTYVHGIARAIHRFVKEEGGIPAAEADAWLAEFDQLEREKAFLYALNRFLFTAVAT